MTPRISRPLIVGAACIMLGCRASDSSRNMQHAKVQEYFRVGSGQADDTLLLMPYRVYLWDGRLAVLDIQGMRVSVFDTTGRLLWIRGREGAGPGEFKAPSAAASGRNGNLWVLDPGNARITQFESDGTISAELSTSHLPSVGSDFAVGEDHVVFFAPTPRNNVMRTSLPELTIQAVETLPWLDSLPRQPHVVFAAANDMGRDRWVAAHTFGPGFFLGSSGKRIGARRYIDEVGFEDMLPPVQLDAAGRVAQLPAVPKSVDVRYGAKQVAWVGDEIYMLFGGRPPRIGQAPEPTNLVDVYSASGDYRRTYRLPVDAWGMAADNRHLYVIQLEPFPALLGYRVID